MRRRPTLRGRLTVLYTSLFLLGGLAVIGITYGLVSQTLPVSSSNSKVSAGTAAVCEKAKRADVPPAELQQKCVTDFQLGVKAGAERQRQQTLNNLLVDSSLTLAGATALAAVAAWIIAGSALRRVHDITTAARAASDTDLSRRVALRGPRDEIYELAYTFNEMLTRLDTSLAGQRRFIANASHELRTPLTVIATTIDVVTAKETPTPEDYATMTSDVRDAVDHAAALVEALLTLARAEHQLAHQEPVDLATAVQDVLDSLPPHKLDVDSFLSEAPSVGDPLLLERLVSNLVDNAVRYNRPGGSVTIRTFLDGQNDRATLTISNTGLPVPADKVHELFEPFHRLHERTGPAGFGLGLTIASTIAILHRGAIDVRAQEAGGLRITVTLPGAHAAADQPVERLSGVPDSSVLLGSSRLHAQDQS